MDSVLEDFFRGATFGDFMIRPRRGLLHSRKDADLAMPLTKNICLRGAPAIPANMRTVSGGKMTAAAALEGSIAFLHRGYSIDEVESRVRHIKGLQAHIIETPLVIHRKATLGEARELIRKKKISGLLVEEKPGDNILAGILSHRDIWGPDSDLVENYMTKCPPDVVFADSGISIEDAEKLMNEQRKEKLPLLGPNRRIEGLITMRDLKMSKHRPYATKDSKGRLIVGVTIGAGRGTDYMKRAEAVIAAGADIILMDIAHGHSVVLEEAIKNFKIKFPEIELIAGNVATQAGARFLADLGVDAIKVGIGPGSGCRTRLETGFGVAQLQAIREAYLAVGNSIPIIADGGIKSAGDISKAIACGASTVMLGGIFAGTDEAPGRKFTDPVTKQIMKKYGGETSPEMKLDQYSDNEEGEDLETDNSEGQMEPVPYTGKVSDLFRRLRGSLQSAVSYGGVKKLSDFHSVFIEDAEKWLDRLTQASREEAFKR